MPLRATCPYQRINPLVGININMPLADFLFRAVDTIVIGAEVKIENHHPSPVIAHS